MCAGGLGAFPGADKYDSGFHLSRVGESNLYVAGFESFYIYVSSKSTPKDPGSQRPVFPGGHPSKY